MKKQFIIIISFLFTFSMFSCQQKGDDEEKTSYEKTASEIVDKRELLTEKINQEVDKIDRQINEYDAKIENASENLDEDATEKYREAKHDLIEMKDMLNYHLNKVEDASKESLSEIEKELNTTTANIEDEIIKFGNEVEAILENDKEQEPA